MFDTSHLGLAMTPRVYHDRDGNPFPATQLDDGASGDARLPADVLARIEELAAEGARQLAARDWRAALETFRGALAVMPEPLEAWNASGWLLVAMAEAAIGAGDFRTALAPIGHATACPGTLGNPWVEFRLGQVRCMLGDLRGVADLERAVTALAGQAEQFELAVTHDKVIVKFRNRVVSTLVGKDAAEVRAAIANGGDVQLLVARKTGNFKRGNERR